MKTFSDHRDHIANNISTACGNTVFRRVRPSIFSRKEVTYLTQLEICCHVRNEHPQFDIMTFGKKRGKSDGPNSSWWRIGEDFLVKTGGDVRLGMAILSIQEDIPTSYSQVMSETQDDEWMWLAFFSFCPFFIPPKIS